MSERSHHIALDSSTATSSTSSASSTGSDASTGDAKAREALQRLARRRNDADDDEDTLSESDLEPVPLPHEDDGEHSADYGEDGEDGDDAANAYDAESHAEAAADAAAAAATTIPTSAPPVDAAKRPPSVHLSESRESRDSLSFSLTATDMPRHTRPEEGEATPDELLGISPVRPVPEGRAGADMLLDGPQPRGGAAEAHGAHPGVGVGEDDRNSIVISSGSDMGDTPADPAGWEVCGGDADATGGGGGDGGGAVNTPSDPSLSFHLGGSSSAGHALGSPGVGGGVPDLQNHPHHQLDPVFSLPVSLSRSGNSQSQSQDHRFFKVDSQISPESGNLAVSNSIPSSGLFPLSVSGEAESPASQLPEAVDSQPGGGGGVASTGFREGFPRGRVNLSGSGGSSSTPGMESHDQHRFHQERQGSPPQGAAPRRSQHAPGEPDKPDRGGGVAGDSRSPSGDPQDSIRITDGVDESEVRCARVTPPLRQRKVEWDQLSGIQVLDVRGCGLRDLDRIPTTLRRLDASCNAISNIEGLRRAPGLEMVNLRRNAISRIPHIPSLRSVRHLFLGRNAIRRVENLEHLTQLETLDLSHNLMHLASHIRPLSMNHALRTLLLRGCPISDPAGRRRVSLSPVPEELNVTCLRGICRLFGVVENIDIRGGSLRGVAELAAAAASGGGVPPPRSAVVTFASPVGIAAAASLGIEGVCVPQVSISPASRRGSTASSAASPRPNVPLHASIKPDAMGIRRRVVVSNVPNTDLEPVAVVERLLLLSGCVGAVESLEELPAKGWAYRDRAGASRDIPLDARESAKLSRGYRMSPDGSDTVGLNGVLWECNFATMTMRHTQSGRMRVLKPPPAFSEVCVVFCHAEACAERAKRTLNGKTWDNASHTAAKDWALADEEASALRSLSIEVDTPITARQMQDYTPLVLNLCPSLRLLDDKILAQRGKVTSTTYNGSANATALTNPDASKMSADAAAYPPDASGGGGGGPPFPFSDTPAENPLEVTALADDLFNLDGGDAEGGGGGGDGLAPLVSGSLAAQTSLMSAVSTGSGVGVLYRHSAIEGSGYAVPGRALHTAKRISSHYSKVERDESRKRPRGGGGGGGGGGVSTAADAKRSTGGGYASSAPSAARQQSPPRGGGGREDSPSRSVSPTRVLLQGDASCLEGGAQQGQGQGQPQHQYELQHPHHHEQQQQQQQQKRDEEEGSAALPRSGSGGGRAGLGGSLQQQQASGAAVLPSEGGGGVGVGGSQLRPEAGLASLGTMGPQQWRAQRKSASQQQQKRTATPPPQTRRAARPSAAGGKPQDRPSSRGPSKRGGPTHQQHVYSPATPTAAEARSGPQLQQQYGTVPGSIRGGGGGAGNTTPGATSAAQHLESVMNKMCLTRPRAKVAPFGVSISDAPEDESFLAGGALVGQGDVQGSFFSDASFLGTAMAGDLSTSAGGGAADSSLGSVQMHPRAVRFASRSPSPVLRPHEAGAPPQRASPHPAAASTPSGGGSSARGYGKREAVVTPSKVPPQMRQRAKQGMGSSSVLGTPSHATPPKRHPPPQARKDGSGLRESVSVWLENFGSDFVKVHLALKTLLVLVEGGSSREVFRYKEIVRSCGMLNDSEIPAEVVLGYGITEDTQAPPHPVTERDKVLAMVAQMRQTKACLRYIFELMEANEYAELAEYLSRVKESLLSVNETAMG